MTAVTLPPEVVAECVERLFCIITVANRDTATLTRQITALLKGKQHNRPLGSLRKYVSSGQYGADEVSEVIAVMEAAMDPKHVKHLARCKARRDKERVAFLESCKKPQPTYWEVTAPRTEAAKPRQNGNVIAGPWLEGA